MAVQTEACCSPADALSITVFKYSLMALGALRPYALLAARQHASANPDPLPERRGELNGAHEGCVVDALRCSSVGGHKAQTSPRGSAGIISCLPTYFLPTPCSQ